MESVARQLGGIDKYFSESMVYFSVAMTGVTWIMGGWDTALKVLVVLAILDITTGILKGFFFEKEFSSGRLRKGFGTKIGYLIVIAICNLLDVLFFVDTPVLRTAAIYFYVAVEGTSIVENLAKMGVPIPKALRDKLAQLNEKHQ